MKKIKYLILCLIVILTGVSSCNKNDVNPVYIPLPIIETFKPVMKEIHFSEIQDLAPYKQQVFIVNSITELPDDEIFGNEEFLDKDIDFSQYSLIIFYDLQFGKIISSKNRWGYSTDLEQYQVSTGYEIEKGSDFIDGEFELATYVRGAMLVDHIPAQSAVGQMIAVHWKET